MFKFNKTLLAVVVATAAIGASAQDLKSDLFNQEQGDNTSAQNNDTSSGAPGASAAGVSLGGSTQSRRVRITNGQAGAGDIDQRRSGLDQDALTKAAKQGNGEQKENEPSEFQKFIADNNAGKMLPIFGSEFFANTPSTFAPVSNTPLPSDYSLGPGDELMVRGWGTIDIDYRATIDRNGTINIPTIGSVSLAGVKAGDAEQVVRAAIGRLYKGVTVNVTFGQLRAITVYVVGQARRPGTYTVSSLSTLVTALFASGGPNANGSMRHVQVKRAGKVAAELDLYSFIAKGDKSADIKLRDGDTIYIPPAGGFVALTGKVNSPAVYELKTASDSVQSILDIAGGLPVVADPRRAFLERIDPGKNHPRTVTEFALNTEGLSRTLKNGDVLNVTSITPDFANAVILRGNVDQPVRAQFKSGMRVSDLIPNREYLISRNATMRQNNALNSSDDEQDQQNQQKSRKDQRSMSDQRSTRDQRTEEKPGIAEQIGGLIDEINWDYAVVERVNRNDLSVKLLPFNLGNVFANPDGPDNLQLQPGDTVTVFSQKDVAVPMDKRRVFVRVEGEVRVPGVYQMTAGDTLQTVLAKAGGPTSNAYLFGTAFYRETVRREQAANLEKAANRLETQLRNEQANTVANARSQAGTDAQVVVAQRQAQVELARETISRFRQMKPSGRIAFGLAPDERSFAHLPQIKLENGDRLVVPARPAFVHVFGAVNAESSPLWRPNSRVKDYLQMAGVNAEADVDNVFVMRVDGTVVSSDSRGWFSGIGGLEVMPGDSIVVPEKLDKESRWTKFTQGTREWAQIFANFGLGAAAIKTLRD
jgi:protein involved in polysaccharide export with SLBB domain